MKNVSENLYHYLDVGERVKLTIAALSRNDDEEIARLRRTCPRSQYTMLDYEYTSQLETLPWIAAQFFEIYNFNRSQILICTACMLAYSFLGSDPLHADKNIQEHHENLYIVKQGHVSHLKALFNGFHEFCNEGGLDEEHILVWLKINRNAMRDFIDEELLIAVDPDDDFTEYVKEVFLKIWRQY